jgi:hypothetical protein
LTIGVDPDYHERLCEISIELSEIGNEFIRIKNKKPRKPGSGRPSLYKQGLEYDLPENKSIKFRLRMLALWAVNEHITRTGIDLTQLAKKFGVTSYFLSRLNHSKNTEFGISEKAIEDLLHAMGYSIELSLVDIRPIYTVQIRRKKIRKNNLL